MLGLPVPCVTPCSHSMSCHSVPYCGVKVAVKILILAPGVWFRFKLLWGRGPVVVEEGPNRGCVLMKERHAFLHPRSNMSFEEGRWGIAQEYAHLFGFGERLPGVGVVEP